MNRMTLHRRLKKLTQMSSTAFIRHIRLKKAAELLRTTDMKVIDIAFAVGFVHTSYFASCFKQRYGCSPSHYSRRHETPVLQIQ